MKDPQGVGQKFNLETYLAARKVARRVAFLFASHVEEGMTEDEGLETLDQLLKKNGVEKKWHPSKFRIGKNTVKSFKEKSDPDVKLQEQDIFFLDIGPIIDGHEADYGQTFTVGQNHEYAHAQKTSKQIFDQLAGEWKTNKLSGKALYERASELAQKHGYILNENMAGHRLGDLPHALHYRGKLSDFESVPLENLWVLEVHIRHPDKEFGAFFEDILM